MKNVGYALSNKLDYLGHPQSPRDPLVSPGTPYDRQSPKPTGLKCGRLGFWALSPTQKPESLAWPVRTIPLTKSGLLEKAIKCNFVFSFFYTEKPVLEDGTGQEGIRKRTTARRTQGSWLNNTFRFCRKKCSIPPRLRIRIREGE